MFLKRRRNKTVLCSLILILVLLIVYFAASGDTVSLKGLVTLLCILGYGGIFFGVRFVVFMQKKMRNKLKPLPKKAQNIFGTVIMAFSVLQAAFQIFSFISGLNSFFLVLFSCFSALFCAVVYMF